MSDLVAFLTARLDEDAAQAKEWRTPGASLFWPGLAARVLREVEAKRKILAIHQALSSYYGESPCCSACWPQPRIGTHPLCLCSTVRALAAVWSDHPDYDPAWA